MCSTEASEQDSGLTDCRVVIAVVVVKGHAEGIQGEEQGIEGGIARNSRGNSRGNRRE